MSQIHIYLDFSNVKMTRDENSNLLCFNIFLEVIFIKFPAVGYSYKIVLITSLRIASYDRATKIYSIRQKIKNQQTRILALASVHRERRMSTLYPKLRILNWQQVRLRLLMRSYFIAFYSRTVTGAPLTRFFISTL